MSKPVLYSYWRSSCSWRVRIGNLQFILLKFNNFHKNIALELKDVDYEYRAVHLVKDGGQQHKKEYKEINPMGQVPALVMPNSQVITQSMAILEFLEENFTSMKLLPAEAFQRAKVREICEVINAGTQPIQNLSVLIKHSPDDQAERSKWAHFWIENGLKSVEILLQKSSGEFCVGDQITLADCLLVPQVYNANRFKVDMSQFPCISRILQNLEKNEAFIKAHPDTQPDKQ